MIQVLRLSRGQPGEHITLRFEVLQFPMQLTDVYVVIGSLVFEDLVLELSEFLSLLFGEGLKILILFSKLVVLFL